jgi:hypothetical protein
MSVQKYFYKYSTAELFNVDGNIVPPGNYNLVPYNSDTVVELVDFTNHKVILGPIEITNLLKENGTAYTSKADLLTGVADFF